MSNASEPEEPAQPASAPDADASFVPRRRGRLPKEPTQQELDELPVKERLELLDRRRPGLHQTLNSIGILLTVLFTAATVFTTQQELHTSQDGQITNRYTKAVEQLGSTKLDIRLGGIYALERLAADSPRDNRTVYDVLCAFVREHDPKPGTKTPEDPTTDIQAALTVIGRRKPPPNVPDDFNPDLTGIRTPNAQLAEANLTDARLFDANLANAYLFRADLAGVNLSEADLADARLSDANLTRAHLFDANLADASLHSADLTRADLTQANLAEADLTGANLTDANLMSADLTEADLTGANLTGANLRGVQGMTPEEIRRQTKTDSRTRF